MKKFFIGFLFGAVMFGSIGYAVTYVAQPATFKVMVNGEEFASDPPALVVEGRTYLPLRAIGDALGVPVNWNEQLRRAEVGYSTSDELEYQVENNENIYCTGTMIYAVADAGYYHIELDKEITFNGNSHKIVAFPKSYDGEFDEYVGRNVEINGLAYEEYHGVLCIDSPNVTISSTYDMSAENELLEKTQGWWAFKSDFSYELLHIFNNKIQTGVAEGALDRDGYIEKVVKLNDNSYEIRLYYPEICMYEGEDLLPELREVIYISSNDKFHNTLILENSNGDKFQYEFAGKEDFYSIYE